MTPKEFFKDWCNIIDFNELQVVLGKLNTLNPELLCPHPNYVFKAFSLCPYENLKVVFLGQDPYPQKGVATGIAFGNWEHTPKDKISPSLEVLKECCINYEIPHSYIEFDNTLESWAKQGVLMLNSALTCQVNNTGSHTMIWRKFIATILKNLSYRKCGIVYVLFGKQAQTFEPYINSRFNNIVRVEHPAYYARIQKTMPHKVFKDIDNLLIGKYSESIKWFIEYN